MPEFMTPMLPGQAVTEEQMFQIIDDLLVHLHDDLSPIQMLLEGFSGKDATKFLERYRTWERRRY